LLPAHILSSSGNTHLIWVVWVRVTTLSSTQLQVPADYGSLLGRGHATDVRTTATVRQPGAGRLFRPWCSLGDTGFLLLHEPVNQLLLLNNLTLLRLFEDLTLAGQSLLVPGNTCFPLIKSALSI
jgi:hypothetical protein